MATTQQQQFDKALAGLSSKERATYLAKNPGTNPYQGNTYVGASSKKSTPTKTGLTDNSGRPVYYDPTGGTDYPTSAEQVQDAQNAFGSTVGEFPTYSTSGGVNIPTYWGANLGFDVSTITPTPTLNSPQQNPTIGPISGVDGQMAYFNEMDKEAKRRAEEARKAALALQTSDKAKQEKGLLSKLMSSPSREQTVAAATANSGIQQYQSDISARSAEIGTLTQEYNKIIAARDSQIATTQDKYASTNFISNQVAQINRNAAPELNRISADINAKTAMMQVSQGQIQNAQKYIAQMVDAVTADKKDTYDMYRLLQSENEQAYNTLRSDYKEAYSMAMSNAKDAWTYSRDQATKVGNLMLENPQAGITPQDSLEEALAKVQRSPKPTTTGSTVGSSETGYKNIVRDAAGNVIRTQNITNGTSGTPAPVKLTNTQVNTGATRLGVTADQFKTLDPQVQSYMTSSYGKNFADAMIDFKNGEAEYKDVKESIDNSMQPQAVKDYLTSVLDKNKPAAAVEERGIWSKLGSWFTGNGYK
jgi:hypothetical protein